MNSNILLFLGIISGTLAAIDYTNKKYTWAIILGICSIIDIYLYLGV